MAGAAAQPPAARRGRREGGGDPTTRKSGKHPQLTDRPLRQGRAQAHHHQMWGPRERETGGKRMPGLVVAVAGRRVVVVRPGAGHPTPSLDEIQVKARQYLWQTEGRACGESRGACEEEA